MSFATISDVEARLGRTLTSDEQTQMTALLADATGYLQSVIGQKVEGATTTIKERAPWGNLRVVLPEMPVRSVDTVELDGVELTAVTEWEWDGERTITILGGYTTTTLRYAVLEVTYTHGTTAIPADLAQITCALALQAFQQLKRTGSLDHGAIQSERIDDYSISYQVGSHAPGMSVPDHVASRLRAKYGAGSYVVGSR